jgi:hypothetical protein
MQQLADQGVPSDDVHFVLVGDTAAPNGGLLERFDLPGNDLSVPSFGITFGDPTRDNLFPTDVYTLEYDGFADFPQYPIDPRSDLNAFAGMIYEHLTYLELSPEQIQNALPLETTGDALTTCYMIPLDDLPLLDPLRLISRCGQPARRPAAAEHEGAGRLGVRQHHRRLEPWAGECCHAFRPVPERYQLGRRRDRFHQRCAARHPGRHLENPDNYQIPALLDNPTLSPLVEAAYTSGLIDTLQPTSLELTQALLGGNFPLSDATLLSPPAYIINDLSSTVSADYAALLPIADTINALTTTLPAFDASLFVDQLEAGNLFGAIGDPIAADVALVPFAIFLGACRITDAVEGTLLNLTSLIP